MNHRSSVTAYLFGNLQKTLTCTICLEFYNSPVTLNACQHTFCHTCFKALFSNLSVTKCALCPICKKSVSRRAFHFNKEIEKGIQYLRSSEKEIQINNTGMAQESDLNPDRLERIQKWLQDCEKAQLEFSSSDCSDTEKRKSTIWETKSLTCIISRPRYANTKIRHSTGNIESCSEVVNIENCSPEVPAHSVESRVLNLLEEECIRGMEEDLGLGQWEKSRQKAEKGQGVLEDLNESKNSTGWVRMKDMKNKIARSAKKGQKYKQLDVSVENGRVKAENGQELRADSAQSSEEGIFAGIMENFKRRGKKPKDDRENQEERSIMENFKRRGKKQEEQENQGDRAVGLLEADEGFTNKVRGRKSPNRGRKRTDPADKISKTRSETPRRSRRKIGSETNASLKEKPDEASKSPEGKPGGIILPEGRNFRPAPELPSAKKKLTDFAQIVESLKQLQQAKNPEVSKQEIKFRQQSTNFQETAEKLGQKGKNAAKSSQPVILLEKEANLDSKVAQVSKSPQKPSIIIREIFEGAQVSANNSAVCVKNEISSEKKRRPVENSKNPNEDDDIFSLCTQKLQDEEPLEFPSLQRAVNKDLNEEDSDNGVTCEELVVEAFVHKNPSNFSPSSRIIEVQPLGEKPFNNFGEMRKTGPKSTMDQENVLSTPEKSPKSTVNFVEISPSVKKSAKTNPGKCSTLPGAKMASKSALDQQKNFFSALKRSTAEIIAQFEDFVSNSESLFSEPSIKSARLSGLSGLMPKEDNITGLYSLPGLSRGTSKESVPFLHTVIPCLNLMRSINEKCRLISQEICEESDANGRDSHTNRTFSGQVSGQMDEMGRVLTLNQTRFTKTVQVQTETAEIFSKSAEIQTDPFMCPNCNLSVYFGVNLPHQPYNNLDPNSTTQRSGLSNSKNSSRPQKRTSSSDSEMIPAKKVNRQLQFSNDSVSSPESRGMKRLRSVSPTNSVITISSTASKRSRLSAYNSKRLYQYDLNIIFDSGAIDSDSEVKKGAPGGTSKNSPNDNLKLSSECSLLLERGYRPISPRNRKEILANAENSRLNLRKDPSQVSASNQEENRENMQNRRKEDSKSVACKDPSKTYLGSQEICSDYDSLLEREYRQVLIPAQGQNSPRLENRTEKLQNVPIKRPEDPQEDDKNFDSTNFHNSVLDKLLCNINLSPVDVQKSFDPSVEVRRTKNELASSSASAEVRKTGNKPGSFRPSTNIQIGPNFETIRKCSNPSKDSQRFKNFKNNDESSTSLVDIRKAENDSLRPSVNIVEFENERDSLWPSAELEQGKNGPKSSSVLLQKSKFGFSKSLVQVMEPEILAKTVDREREKFNSSAGLEETRNAPKLSSGLQQKSGYSESLAEFQVLAPEIPARTVDKEKEKSQRFDQKNSEEKSYFSCSLFSEFQPGTKHGRSESFPSNDVISSSLCGGSENGNQRKTEKSETGVDKLQLNGIYGKNSAKIQKKIVTDEELDEEVSEITKHIVEDSLDSDGDIFDDINIVESTPQKTLEPNRAVMSKTYRPNLLPIAEVSNDVNELEWNNIPPPPEFQDSEQIKPPENTAASNFNAANLTSMTPDLLSINQDDFNRAFFNNTLLNSAPNTGQFHGKSSGENHLVEKPTAEKAPELFSGENKGLSKSVETGKDSKGPVKSLNPIVLAQSGKFSPLDILVNSSAPKSCQIQLTPKSKQKSILSYFNASQISERSHEVKLGPGGSEQKYLHERDLQNLPQKDPRNLVETLSQNQPQNNSLQEKNLGNSPEIQRRCNTQEEEQRIQKPFCISSSRMGKMETMSIMSLTRNLKGKYSKDFDKNVTHLVVVVDENNCVKDHTIKYVQAIAHSIWVVSFIWVKDSLMQNKFLPEEPYEVLDVSGKPGPKLSRLHRKIKPLLKNFVIFCADPLISVTKQDLEDAIVNLGGEVRKSEQQLIKDKEKIRLILTEAKISQDFQQYQMWKDMLNVLVVDIEWLSRTVGQYELTSVRPFLLCLEDDIETLGYPEELTAFVPESLTQ